MHEGQKHLFCDDKTSGVRNWLTEVLMLADTVRVSIPSFFSNTEAQKQVLQEIVYFVLEIKWLAANDTHISSSKTTCSIYATSWCILELKDTPVMLNSLRFKAPKKLDGSAGLVEFFYGHVVTDSSWHRW